MLFSLRGIPIWTPIVDEFLKSENLVLRDTLLPLSVPAVDPPAYLSSHGRDAFRFYLQGAPHKAFAATPDGQTGLIFGRRTTEEAEKEALENCAKYAGKNDPCTIVMVDDEKKQN